MGQLRVLTNPPSLLSPCLLLWTAAALSRQIS